MPTLETNRRNEEILKRNILGLPLLLVVFAIGATSTAYATNTNGVAPSRTDAPIALNQWYTFGFGAVGSSFTNGAGENIGTNPASIAAPDPAWTFTLPSSGTLTFVDGALSGDQFNITDSGASLGDTSVPILGADCGGDITACLNNPDMSTGVFALGAGTHAIDGTAVASPENAGAAFFEVTPTSVPDVPAPAAFPLFATGLGALGLLGWRRKRKPRVSLLGAA